MEPADDSADFPDGAEFEPERWETAIEDFAQVVAMGIDRAQDLADLLGDFARTHPGLAKTLGAVAVGTVAGVVIAGVTARGRKPGHARRGAGRRSNANGQLADDLVGLAGDLVQGMARRVASRAAGDGSRADGASPRRAWRPSRAHFGHAAQLVPIAFTLFRNPLVRQVIVRSAIRAARRG